MIALCMLLAGIAFVIALPMTLLARSLGRRLNAMDSPGVAGQVKMSPRRVPNTGGIGLFWGVAAPFLGIIALAKLGEAGFITRMVPELARHLPGLVESSGHALVLLGGLLVLHVMGLVDDRRPMGPWVKLGVMVGVSLAVIIETKTRLLTLLDGPAHGPWASYAVTVIWFVVVTNAMNFLDNMDGLSAGVGAIASGFFLTAALVNEQWFVAAALAVLLGSLLGFLWFNFPRRGGATIFMGDGGSLVLGFLLAFLTARTTYYSPKLGGGWYAVFMPLVVLAIPLYDFVTVTAIRLSKGRSPFVGDLNHLSHRLVRRGLSRRDAVLVIYALTAVTAIGGVSLGGLSGWQAVLVAVQTLLVLAVIALVEWASAKQAGEPNGDGR
ncbi:MAG: undecaprenyl/decaprenyl-phosphate alpha-N-acetylglucosaminyl 1-phosphate transferase [Phycisphaeraceae bacterium]|nr:undecaprenyl/decaprenyl-phosphate alpha-N-acetylglucosaminyl 1-phosphate transferase [Phycisphaeraceae bacterium]